MDLLGKANPKIQSSRWTEIVERYFREVDESSFEIFLKDRKKDVVWDCDLVIMQAGLQLANLGIEEGYEALAALGIKGDNPEQLAQKIKGRITNHELRKSNKSENTNKQSDFFVMLAQVRKHGYDIDGNILLQEWIGTLTDIKDSNERNNTEA